MYIEKAALKHRLYIYHPQILHVLYYPFGSVWADEMNKQLIEFCISRFDLVRFGEEDANKTMFIPL